MELGGGVRVKAIKGHDYLYVWHYERDGARRRQVYDYIGPASDSEARRRAIDSLEGHARRAIEEARHRIEAGRALAGSPGREAPLLRRHPARQTPILTGPPPFPAQS